MSAKNLGKATGQTNFATVEKPVADGVTVHDGDFVRLVGGYVTNATIGTGKLLGVVNGGASRDLVHLSAPDLETTGDDSVDPEPSVLVELATDNRFELPVSAALAADAEGSYYNLTGGAGAQKVDNTSKSASAGQLLCVERKQDRDGNYTIGVFIVADNQFNGVTDTTA